MGKKVVCQDCKKRKRRCLHNVNSTKNETSTSTEAIYEEQSRNLGIHKNVCIEGTVGTTCDMRDGTREAGTLFQTQDSAMPDDRPFGPVHEKHQPEETGFIAGDYRCLDCISGKSCLRISCPFFQTLSAKIFHRQVQEDHDMSIALTFVGLKISN
ncbi:hypothetical protein MPH_08996 [Macrophomina phaseolina MS6]|uniref:Uncharacterized protein n=1 Tax=Macrophomina phaseolina (strain MS6) TaxID=1126212 RepID=K2SAB7_MACPH|nr:hypothetical protein MPH_08996 [Macrophomina phaseolina MS6]